MSLRYYLDNKDLIVYTCKNKLIFLLHRKEVIHPHVLVGVPCYDLTPITTPTLDVTYCNGFKY